MDERLTSLQVTSLLACIMFTKLWSNPKPIRYKFFPCELCFRKLPYTDVSVCVCWCTCVLCDVLFSSRITSIFMLSCLSLWLYLCLINNSEDEFSLCYQAVLETVAKITHEKSKKNDTPEAKYGGCLQLLWNDYAKSNTWSPKQVAFLLAVAQDRFNCKMFSLWKMKVPMTWQPWSTKRCV